VPLVTVVVRITSAQHVAEIVRPLSANLLTTVPSHILTLPTKILANIISVYVNHLPSVIWLRIQFSITLSIYQSSNLPPERCTYSTFTQHTHLSFPNIIWYITRASIYDLYTPIPLCAGAKTGSTNIAYLIPMYVVAHSTANTVLVMRKLSRHCVLTKIDGGVHFVTAPYSSLRNVWWMMWDNHTTDCLVLSSPNSCKHVLLYLYHSEGSVYPHWYVM